MVGRVVRNPALKERTRSSGQARKGDRGFEFNPLVRKNPLGSLGSCVDFFLYPHCRVDVKFFSSFDFILFVFFWGAAHELGSDMR
jgi:hypothetical protein